MLLEAKNIQKNYFQDKLKVDVLKNINFSVEMGDYVAVMGPSGSGKSTLMNILGCIDLPTSGDYFLNGKDVLSLSEDELSDLRLNEIGFVFQNFQLLSSQSALENVELPLTYAKIPKSERRRRAIQALERVGLGDRLHFKPTQLSGGQKQRVAIARAIVNHPSLLLADEPTGALDSKSGIQIMDLFRQLNDEGVTIVMITHDAKVAQAANRQIAILDGELIHSAVKGRWEW